MKNIINTVKEKLKNLRIVNVIKNAFAKVSENETVKTTTEKVKNAKGGATEFNKTHANIVNLISGNVITRMQELISKLKKKFKKNKNSDKKPGKMNKVLKVMMRIICILLAIGFGILVAVAIKDVFIYCLELAALCGATVLCIEFILWVLGTAVGHKI